MCVLGEGQCSCLGWDDLRVGDLGWREEVREWEGAPRSGEEIPNRVENWLGLFEGQDYRERFGGWVRLRVEGLGGRSY